MRAPDPQRLLDTALRRVAEVARALPATVARSAHGERQRLIDAVERGRVTEPLWESTPVRVDPETWALLDAARRLADESPVRALVLERAEELEIELHLLEALGDPRRVRPLAARRYGTGRDLVTLGGERAPLRAAAESLLGTIDDTPEPLEISADGDEREGTTLAGAMRRVAASMGLEIDVRVDPTLTAGAATGERIVLLAARRFGRREATRLVVHEVLGHVVAAANARAQKTVLASIGTPGSFAEQEGLAIWLEEKSGCLDGRRIRLLAARVLATDWMHEGARFGATAHRLAHELGFPARVAVGLAERAFRGGGVARDAGYLRGWLDVRAAIARGAIDPDVLRAGRLSVRGVDALEAAGLLRAPAYTPSLSRSLLATGLGTRFETSPPSLVTSLHRFDAT